MGRNRYKIFENCYPYFLTSTIIECLPLFSNKKIAEIIINSLHFMIKNNRLDIYGYVIMENHIHLIAQAEDLVKEFSDFKSFTARKIIDYFNEYHNNAILQKLEFYKLAHKSDRKYQIWQDATEINK